ncbi:MULTISPECIES: hypothetical protein [Rhodomicrobium]|uniref:hypothetical protein n=1 Tax=Rhodomicrobium TaxID=1068 RepID=UPI00148220B5|nr:MULTISPECIES: hypothetical protein [Rhodomicrobium]
MKVVEEESDITMPELSARLMSEHGVQADPATLSRFYASAALPIKNADGVGMRSRRYPG